MLPLKRPLLDRDLDRVALVGIVLGVSGLTDDPVGYLQTRRFFAVFLSSIKNHPTKSGVLVIKKGNVLHTYEELTARRIRVS